MPRGIRLVFFYLLIPWTLAAQDMPRVEIFGGYSHFRMPSGFAPDSYAYTTESANLNGWNVTATANLNRWVGIDADFGGYYGNATAFYWRSLFPGYFEQDFSIRTYLFGPRLSYRGHHRLTPFFHALFGKVLLARAPVTNAPQSSFGMALGGGLDVNMARHVAIRAIQADYAKSSLSYRKENNLRLSTGLVFRF